MGTRGLATATLMLCLGLVAGCSSDSDDSATDPDTAAATPVASASATTNSADVPFVLFEDNAPAPGWRLSEAVQPAADAMSFYEEITPGMAWYAEWSGPSEDDYLSLNMIRLTLSALQEASPLTDPVSGEIDGREAQWGENLNGGASATTTVRMTWAPGWTVELRSTESAGALRAMAARLHAATKKEWRAAGGQSGCRPFASKCDG